MIPFCGPGRGDKLAYFSGIFYSIGFYAAGDVYSVRTQDADGVGDMARVQTAGDEKFLSGTSQLAASLPIESDTGTALLSGDETVQQQPTVGVRFKRSRVEVGTDANGVDQRTVQVAPVFGRFIAVQLDIVQSTLTGSSPA